MVVAHDYPPTLFLTDRFLCSPGLILPGYGVGVGDDALYVLFRIFERLSDDIRRKADQASYDFTVAAATEGFEWRVGTR